VSGEGVDERSERAWGWLSAVNDTFVHFIAGINKPSSAKLEFQTFASFRFARISTNRR